MSAMHVSWHADGTLTSVPVLVAERFVTRWRGMRAHRGAMLFRASSVHGLGMDRPLAVVALDGALVVVAVRTLEPGSVVRVPGARWMIEVEVGLPVPSVGERVSFYDRRDGRTTRGVRHADREPGRRVRAARRGPTHG